MTIDRQPFTGELHGCAPKQRNCATLPPAPATGRATGTQPTSLKAAAARVLQRNRARNLHATEAENPRNSERATEAAEVAQVARPADPVALLAGADPDPAAHCDRCGSPSWWRSPSSLGWRCAYCEPRDRSRIEAHESLTLAGGQWAPGCAPPAPVPVTVDDLLAIHGETVAGCRTLDVLEQADDTDLPELRDRVLLEGFAAALVADRRIRPLPDASLPTLHRLALELGDDPAELRAWLDRTGPGRALRVRLEREHGACDRCLLALRDDPDGPLLPLLARALDGDRTAEPVPDDGRVQDGFGAWRAEIEHDAIRAFYRHHWRCTICQRAGRGYANRCAEGERLHELTKGKPT